MGFLDFLKREKTEEKPEAKKAAPAPKPSPKPGRTAESLQAEQLRLLRGTAILNGERLKGLRPERIADDLKKIDRARGLADLELKLGNVPRPGPGKPRAGEEAREAPDPLRAEEEELTGGQERGGLSPSEQPVHAPEARRRAGEASKQMRRGVEERLHPETVHQHRDAFA